MKELKEIHVNETNLLLEDNLVNGGILPGKIAELTRIVTIQRDTVIEGPLYAAKIEIRGGDTRITGAAYTPQEIYIDSDAEGSIDFEKCVASSSSVVSRSRRCSVSFHSDINAKSVSLVNTFVAGSIYADKVELINCVVIGGVFSTDEAIIENSIVGTFNAPTVKLDGIVQLLLPTAFSVTKAQYNANSLRLYNLSLADLGALYKGLPQSPDSGKIVMDVENDSLKTTLVDAEVQKSVFSYTVVGKVLAADLLDVDKFQNHFLLTSAALGPQLLRTYDLGLDCNGNPAVLSFEKLRIFFMDIMQGKIEVNTINGKFNISDLTR